MEKERERERDEDQGGTAQTAGATKKEEGRKEGRHGWIKRKLHRID